MTGIFRRRERFGGIHTGKIVYEDRSREPNDACTGKAHHRQLAAPEAERQSWNRFLIGASRGSTALLTP